MTSDIINYELISSRNSHELSKVINDYLKSGWKLYGEPFGNTVTYNGSFGDTTQDNLFQAVVKYKS